MMRRIVLSASLACALVLSAAGCAGNVDGEDSAAESPISAVPSAEQTSAPEGEDNFCTELADALPELELLVFAANMDDPKIGDRLANAATTFAEASPPAELSEDWKAVANLFSVLATAFAGVDPTDGDQLRAAQATLDEGIDEQAAAAAESGERITAYASENCSDVNANANAETITDACELLTAEELQRVFPADDPTAEGNNFGEGFFECVWTGLKAELIVSVLPSATLAADYTDLMTPFDTAADFGDLADAQAYESLIGIGRVSTQGHTVIFTTGEHGVMVAVRLGEEGSRPADTGAAAELAQAVDSRL